MNFNRPPQIITIVKEGATDKASKKNIKLLILAFLGGSYIALGSMFAIKIAAGLEGFSSTNPGLITIAFGLTFPLGFVLVTLAGAELFTSTTAIMSTGFFSGIIKWKSLLRVWLISYLGNFVGAIFVAYVIAGQSHIFDSEIYRNFIFNIANHKLENSFFTTFIKGVGANWLVCLAAFLTYSSKDTVGKIAALWPPVTAFVCLGFEHSIANMFFIPVAKVLGYDVSWGAFLVKNLIPATLGNITGGVILVGLLYSYIYSERKKNS